MSDTLRFGPYSVELSRPDKLLFPDAGVSKRDLVDHYRAVSDVMLPYLRGRPVVMQRFPDGIGSEGFYQKDAPDYFPDWIPRVTVPKREGGTVDHVLCRNAATLAYLAGQGVITPHVWLSRADDLEHPDRLIFDLDPPDHDFDLVRRAAESLRGLLAELGLRAWPLATGGRGLHLVLPLDRSADFDGTREFARRTAALLAARQPDRLTVETRKQSRRGRLFLDYLRNGFAQTAVPPFAVRARPGAPVAVPLDWDDVGDPRVRGDAFTVRSLPARLERKGDPWKGMTRHARSLDGPRARLAELEAEAGTAKESAPEA